MPTPPIQGRSLVNGSAHGPILHTDTSLSFWGGVDPLTGTVIDRHHPLCGQPIGGHILALPSGRGSCTGSSVLLELLLNGHAPAALVLAEAEDILTLGVLVAQTMFDHSIPVLCIGHEAFTQLRDARHGRIENARLLLDSPTPAPLPEPVRTSTATDNRPTVALTAEDQAMLQGSHGAAAQLAMRLVLRMAELQGARELIDITQAHIDGCIYTGPASLRFAELLVEKGAHVRVPTTLNSISVDKRRWRELGISESLGDPASRLGDAYLAMGARLSFTCAPYLLDSAPSKGEHIVWAESNAVVYANSVLGARTLKYPDYLDICIAITGRAPHSGCHQTEQRMPTLRIQVPRLEGTDDAFYPLLGYHIGLLCGSEIPHILGLEHAAPSQDDLKAFGAAFATTSAAPMFHIASITAESGEAEQATHGNPAIRTIQIDIETLQRSWRELDKAPSQDIQLLSLGNPHLSLSECATLASLCEGRAKHPQVAMVITMGRHVHEQATALGYIQRLERFGALVLTDTCWCMLGEPVIPPRTRTLMTNSGKYAHYAPGLVGRDVRFGGLAACVDAAVSGSAATGLPRWLENR